MKKVLLISLFIFSCTVSYTQTKSDYERAMSRVQEYLNTSQLDLLCSLFQPNSQNACVWTDAELAWILNCFGKIQSVHYLAQDDGGDQDGRVYFRVQCSKRTVIVSCILGLAMKFVHFEFNDKSRAAQRASLKTHH